MPPLNKDEIFPAKILLFGEYTLITGSKGLAIPLHDFYASFERTDKPVHSHFKLDEFHSYLSGSDILSQSMNLDAFAHDIKHGLYVASAIPHGYGIGSSGALCAAIYARYAHDFDRSKTCDVKALKSLRDIMALMENFYHGASSGLDCLVSLIDAPILVRPHHHYETCKLPNINSLGHFYLYDSGQPRKTSAFVHGFLDQYKADAAFKDAIDAYTDIVDALIDMALNPAQNFVTAFAQLSEFQLRHFASMIPAPVKEIWKNGLSSGKYIMKLCGAGGGGYFLIYTPEKLDKNTLNVFPVEF